MQDFELYFPGSPSNPIIEKGDGFWVGVTEESMWYGDAEGNRNENRDGNASFDNDSLAFPYPVYGYAYYRDVSGFTEYIPAEEANVTLINNRTGEKLYTTVDEYGYYIIDLNEMGWEDGDEFTIFINGTGEYYGWNGIVYIEPYTDDICFHVDDIIPEE